MGVADACWQTTRPCFYVLQFMVQCNIARSARRVREPLPFCTQRPAGAAATPRRALEVGIETAAAAKRMSAGTSCGADMMMLDMAVASSALCVTCTKGHCNRRDRRGACRGRFRRAGTSPTPCTIHNSNRARSRARKGSPCRRHVSARSQACIG